MRFYVVWAFAFVLFLCAQMASAAPALKDYAGLPDVAYSSLSPDGRYVALTRPYKGKAAAFIYDIDNGGDPKIIFNEHNNMDMKNYQWLGPKHISFTLSRFDKTGREMHVYRRLAVYNMETGKFATMISKGAHEVTQTNYSITWVVSTLPNEPEHILMAAYVYIASNAGLQKAASSGHKKSNSGFAIRTFKVNLSTGKAKKSENARQDTSDIVVDIDGKMIARYDFDDTKNVYSAYGRDGKKWKQIYKKKGTARTFDFEGLAQTPNTAIISQYGKTGFLELVEMSLETGVIGKVIFQPTGYDFDYVLKDPKTREIVGVAYQDDKPKRRFFDRELRQWQAELKASFEGQDTVLLQWNQERTRFLVYVDGGGTTGEYHLFDTADMSLSKLGSEYPTISGADITSVTSYKITASDGLKIPGYLTLPPSKTASSRNLALVVMPHGGPESRDGAEFDYWAQFLTSKGYAVYQPNFRGSSGYGAVYRDAGHSEFGGKMVDDVVDGTRALISQGIADPNKICIMGASYGGYAALAASVKAPDLYKCVISVNGVTNVGEFFSWSVDRYGKDGELANYWRRWIGEENLMQLPGKTRTTTRWSPSRNADKIKASVLLLHGDQDTNVPYEQFKFMRSALRKAGVDFEAVTVKGDDHYLDTTAVRTHVLGTSGDFLDKYIGD